MITTKVNYLTDNKAQLFSSVIRGAKVTFLSKKYVNENFLDLQNIRERKKSYTNAFFTKTREECSNKFIFDF